YDLGRNGFAYFDKDTADYHVSTGKNTPGNRGRAYRNDGVDLRRDSTDKTLVNVTDIEDGEWLQYTVNIAKSGKYTLKLMVAADHSKGVITVNNGKDQPVAASIAVPNTGGMNVFK